MAFTEQPAEGCHRFHKMSRATPKLRKIAGLLIAHETGATASAEPAAPEAFPVCAKLRPQLAMLMGRVGAHALLSRALVMACAEVEWLRTVQLSSDGTLGVASEVLTKLNPAERMEGSVLLVAQLLGLLVAFIGENLTLRQLRDVWPELSLDEFISPQEID